MPYPTNRELTQSLIEKGFLIPAKPGRPRIYATEEDRVNAHRTQQRFRNKHGRTPIYATEEDRMDAKRRQNRACNQRSDDRVREALKRMIDASKPPEMPSVDT